MKTLTVADLKSQFSTVIEDLRSGREVQITYGRNHTPLGRIVPQSKLAQPSHAIKLGDLRDKGYTMKIVDFEMTEAELLGLR